MVGRVRPIEKYILIGFVVPKLGPHDQQWKGFVLGRRGVFAQVIGSLELPAPHERKRVVGVIINEASRSKLRAILQNSPRSRPCFAPASSKASVSNRSFSEDGKATEGSPRLHPRSKLRDIRRKRLSSSEKPRYLRMVLRSSRNGRAFRPWGSFRSCAIVLWIRKTAELRSSSPGSLWGRSRERCSGPLAEDD